MKLESGVHGLRQCLPGLAKSKALAADPENFESSHPLHFLFRLWGNQAAERKLHALDSGCNALLGEHRNGSLGGAGFLESLASQLRHKKSSGAEPQIKEQQ